MGSTTGRLTLDQRVNGGRGGMASRPNGLAGQAGAASSILTGTNPGGGSLSVYSGAAGGNGGATGSGMAAKNGANATSTVSANASAANADVQATSRANGGYGGYAPLGGIAGDGGNANADASGLSLGKSGTVTIGSSAGGGNGGNAGNVSGDGNGGADGDAVASATNASSAGYNYIGVSTVVSAAGGDGGDGAGIGFRGGNGGTANVTASTAIGSGPEANISAELHGGQGGSGRRGADGGNGGNINSVNALSGSGSVVSLELFETGGNGGSSAGGRAGNGGNASLVLTSKNSVGVMKVSGIAYGGSTSASSVAGNAFTQMEAIGATKSTAKASAYSGSASVNSNLVNLGRAQAEATEIVTAGGGASTNDYAYAIADAKGTTGSALARAGASSGMVQEFTSSVATVASGERVLAIGSLNVNYTRSVYDVSYAGTASSVTLPTAAIVNGRLAASANTKVSAAVKASGMKTVGLGSVSFSPQSLASTTLSGEVHMALNVAEGGINRLVIGFVNPVLRDNGFSRLDLTVTLEDKIVLAMSFTNVATAISYLTDQAVNLSGKLPSAWDGAFDIGVRFDLTPTSSLTSGFSTELLIATDAVPEPSVLALLSVACGALFFGLRRRRHAFAGSGEDGTSVNNRPTSNFN